MSHGHDYGLGQTNIDHATGIRYGCISTHSLSPYFWEDVEHDYGPPTCPVCGNDADNPSENPDYNGAVKPYREHSCADHFCKDCLVYFSSEDAFPDEPLGWSLVEGTTKIVDCLDSDALVLKSRYYTFAPFCSPCVPGAGNLDNVYADVPEIARSTRNAVIGEAPKLLSFFGVKTYCLDKSFFEHEACPYPYWSVETNELVYCPGDDSSESLGNPAGSSEGDSLEENDPDEDVIDALRSMLIEEPSDDVIDEIVRAYRGENGQPLE